MKDTKKSKDNIFPVVLSQEKDGGYFVMNPAFEGCYSQGDTIEETLANIKEVTEMCVEESKEQGKKLAVHNVSLHLIHA